MGTRPPGKWRGVGGFHGRFTVTTAPSSSTVTTSAVTAIRIPRIEQLFGSRIHQLDWHRLADRLAEDLCLEGGLYTPVERLGFPDSR